MNDSDDVVDDMLNKMREALQVCVCICARASVVDCMHEWLCVHVWLYVCVWVVVKVFVFKGGKVV